MRRSPLANACRALILLGALVPLPLAGVEDAAPRSGRHFVLLIDDSRDMRRFADELHRELPPLFFANGDERTVDWPAFDPERDVLTTLFFTIHRDRAGDECKSVRSFSTLPRALFQNAPVAERVERASFTRALAGWLGLPCRWNGTFSPIVTATTLAVPEAARVVGEGTFSSTILVVATNDFFNTTVSPAFELRHLLHNDDGKNLRDTAATQKLLEEVLHRFRFDLPDGWSRDAGRGADTLFVRVFRVHPLATTPEALVAPPPVVELDRVATSPERIAWRAGDRGSDELRLTAAEGLSPLRLFWRVHDGKDRPWLLGAVAVPVAWHRLDLDACGDACRQSGDTKVVSLGEVLALPTMGPADPLPRQGAVIDLQVEFGFDSGGVYELLHPWTAARRVELRLAPVATLESTPLAAEEPVTNRILTDLWRPRDVAQPARGLTQATALDRLLVRRDRRNLLLIVAAVATSGAFVFTLFRTAYHRPFRPALDWRHAGAVSLDLSQHGSGRVLVGTVGVVNHGRQPWFGRLLGNQEQPTRRAGLEIDPLDSAGLGFTPSHPTQTAMGYLASESGGIVEDLVEDSVPGGDEVVTRIQRAVSHGQRVPVFVATEALADFDGPLADADGAIVEVESLARMLPLPGGAPTSAAATRVGFALRVLPEVATPPLVSFEPARGGVEYRHDAELEVGCFVFTSLARHRFAVPHESVYELEALRDRTPLAGPVLRLRSQSVRVASGERVRVPVILFCDGETIRNPEPARQAYTVQLLGACDAESRRGPHEIVLQRDSTRAEAEIGLTYLGTTWDLHRTADSDVVLTHAAVGRTLRAEEGVLTLDGDFPFRVPAERTQIHDPTFLSLRVGNSGRSGRGRVTVEVSRRVELTSQAAARLHLEGGTPAERLVVCLQDGQEVPFVGVLPVVSVAVGEGEPEQERTFKLHGEPVAKIDGSRLSADQVRVVLGVRVTVVDDRDDVREWTVDLAGRVAIEKLPGPNWLCIDLGTSAIAAAVGRADGDTFHRLDLQRVEVAKGKSLATADVANLEAGTPFLPSWIVCDGDIRYREGKRPEVEWPAGFPLHLPASIDLASPSFVGLPVLDAQLRTRPERIVFSLKQWLAVLAPSVRLPDTVTFRTAAGETRTSSLVPLDELLESTFGALVETYLAKMPDLAAQQVVLTHPNSFSPRHRERLHRIAAPVLQRRLHIAAPDHVTLLSESDAVAYAYCVDVLGNGQPRRGTERILVYDFGAGTLDLSLVHVQWRTDRRLPQSWKVEARIGLPLAGNYVDELLMRLVDRELRKAVEGTGWDYRYPAVGRSASHPVAHRLAVLDTWRALREAKHGWDGTRPFEVMLGVPGGEAGVLVALEGALSLPAAVPADRSALFLTDRDVRLSIPAAVVRAYGPFHDLLAVVGDDAIDEVLAIAGLPSTAVDTLIVSGRGALWPGLRETVEAKLPRAVMVEPGGAAARKDVVALGAVAFQALRHQLALEAVGPARPRLGILLGRRQLIGEEEWADGRAVDLSGYDEFRLVQVPLHDPDVERDLAGLRRHFYIELTAIPILRQTLWKDDPRLYVSVRERGLQLQITLSNAMHQSIDIDQDADPQRQPPEPPWPMGSFLLEPEETDA